MLETPKAGRSSTDNGKFLVVVPPGISSEGIEVRNHVPLGTVSVLSAAVAQGYDVSMLDCVGEARKDNYLVPSNPYYNEKEINGDVFRVTGLVSEKIRNRIAQIAPNIIGVSCLTLVDRSETKKIIRDIKRDFPNIPIILGGHEASQNYDEILGFTEYEIDTIPGVDYVVVGPGQPHIVQLLECIQGRGAKEDLRGVAFVNDGKLQFTPHDKPFNPNEHPVPDYSMLPSLNILGREKPIDIYSLIGITHAGDIRGLLNMSDNDVISYMALLTSYGCGYSCTYCDNGQSFVRYESDRVIAMIDQVDELYGLEYIDFMDNNFAGNSGQSRTVALEILKKLRGKGYDLAFSNGLTFESMARNDFELLRAIKEAGRLRHIAFPIENANDRVLKMVRKPHNKELVEKVLKFFNVFFAEDDTRKEGFLICGFPETRGFPAETSEEITASYNFIEHSLQEGWLDQAIFLTLSPVTKEYRRQWRKQFPNGPFEQALFSKGVGIWPGDNDFIRDMHTKVRELNQRYGSKTTRRM
jgi:radical SAM superfamily enzyme YgiQ (UPF0313 family)